MARLMDMTRNIGILGLFATLLVTASPLAGQRVMGRVLDEVTTRGIPDVRVSALMGTRVMSETLTDEGGRFQLVLRQGGRYTLEFTRIGYTLEKQVVEVEAVGTSQILVRMRSKPVEVDEIRVTEQRRVSPVELEYTERVEKNKALGMGDFIEREDIASANSDVTSLLRRFPYVRIRRAGIRGNMLRMRGMGGECAPRVFIDGSELHGYGSMGSALTLDDMVSSNDVATIEVYHGLSQGPGIYADPQGCGSVLIWTQRGVPNGEGRPVPVWVAVGMVALGLLVFF